MKKFKKPEWALFFFIACIFFLTASEIRAAARSSKTGSESQTRESGKGKKETKKTSTKGGKKEKEADAETKKEDQLFLPEPEESQKYSPDMYRCVECGYEQDEPGLCPDHEAAPLVKILSKGKSPLEPLEVDGNEDLLVDIPLSSLTLRKAAPAQSVIASPSAPLSPEPTTGRKHENSSK